MKPMLAGKADDLSKLTFPVMASYKLDGVRALVIDGVVVSRQLKPIPNAWVQKTFSTLPEGTDGELIFGDPTHPEAYRKTVSAVMSEDGEPTDVHFDIFDNFLANGGFSERYNSLLKIQSKNSNALLVVHDVIETAGQLEAFEASAVDAGYEGIMVRSINGPYKFGRSTAKEGYLLKVKRFEDAEATVVGFEELMHNGNEAKKDNLGHTERSSHKENLVGRNALGALNVIGAAGTYKDVEFSIGTGFQGDERVELWKTRAHLIGRTVKFKYFPTGSKDRPRFPVFLGWRDKIDS